MHRNYIFVLLLFTLSSLLYAQQKQTFTFSTDNSFLLKELTAIVQEKDGKIVFHLIPEQVLQQDKFKNLDLQMGDEILFINGTKVKELSDLRKAYDEIKVGEEIKLGIQRGKEQFFAMLTKEDQSAGGKQMMIIGSGDNGSLKSNGGKVKMNGKEVDLDSLKKTNNILTVPQNKKKGN